MSDPVNSFRSCLLAFPDVGSDGQFMSLEIEIKGLKFYAYHGVMARERKVGQQFEVDVRLEIESYDGSDNLDTTVNYADVISAVKAEMAEPSNLIEHVCFRICERLRRDFPKVCGGEVEVRKMRPPVETELNSVSTKLKI